MSWLIRIRQADVFLNGKLILNAIDWTMKHKENWAVVGINGAGKTSFMKLVFGELIPIDGGEVKLRRGRRAHPGAPRVLGGRPALSE